MLLIYRCSRETKADYWNADDDLTPSRPASNHATIIHNRAPLTNMLAYCSVPTTCITTSNSIELEFPCYSLPQPTHPFDLKPQLSAPVTGCHGSSGKHFPSFGLRKSSELFAGLKLIVLKEINIARSSRRVASRHYSHCNSTLFKINEYVTFTSQSLTSPRCRLTSHATSHILATGARLMFAFDVHS